MAHQDMRIARANAKMQFLPAKGISTRASEERERQTAVNQRVEGITSVLESHMGTG